MGLPALLFHWPVDVVAMRVDLAFMVLVTLAVFFMAWLGWSINRLEAVLLLLSYAGYLTYLCIDII